MEMRYNLFFFLCFLSTATFVVCWPDSDFYGLTQVCVVVANLEEATEWYTRILGGQLIPKLSLPGEQLVSLFTEQEGQHTEHK